MDDSVNEAVVAAPTRLVWRVLGAAVVGLLFGAAWFWGAYGGDFAVVSQTSSVPFFGSIITGELLTWQQKMAAIAWFALPMLLVLGASLLSDWRRQRLTRFRRAYLTFALWGLAAPLTILLILWGTHGDTFSDASRLWLAWAALILFLYFLIIPPLILPGLVGFCLASITGIADEYGNLLGATTWFAFVLAYTLAVIRGFTVDHMGLYGTLMVLCMLLGLPFALLTGQWGERLRTLRT